jgi:hypothetical protein
MFYLHKMQYQKLFKFCTLIFFYESIVLNLNAQDSCSMVLSDAQNLYKSGQIEDIPQMLAHCLESGFNDNDRIEAYKLIVLSYIFNQEKLEADSSMLSFLKKYPEYQITNREPAEFTQLYKSFRTLPIFSVGFSVGGNITFPVLIKNFITNGQNIKGKYNYSGIGYNVGLQFSYYIKKNLQINLEGNYFTNKFSYNLVLPNYLSINSLEKQSKLEIPVSLTYCLSEQKLIPYVRLGFAMDYLLSSNESNRLLIVSQNKEISGSANVKRRQFNYSAIFGGGLKYKVTSGFVFLDLKWKSGFLNQSLPGNKFNNVETFMYQSPENDFGLNNLVFSVGFVHSFYKQVKKKQ